MICGVRIGTWKVNTSISVQVIFIMIGKMTFYLDNIIFQKDKWDEVEILETYKEKAQLVSCFGNNTRKKV